MPRKAREEIDEVKEKTIKKEVKSKKVASATVATKKAATKKESKKVVDKKAPSKKSAKTGSKKDVKNEKSSAVKNITEPVKKSNTRKSVTKAPSKTSKKSKSKTNTNSKKTATNSKTSKRATTKKQSVKKIEVVEYYDLPYRYNQTAVKVLAQTPNTLFVYWDISDDDRKKYIEQYGEYFFNNTKPVLIIHNKTKNYSFEVDINDFANSWYLSLVDSNCDYNIELGRRPINKYANIPNNYLYITTSNEIESPNDHILFDRLSHFVYFKNVKTNEAIKKHTNLTLLSKIGKFSSVQEFYKKLYPDEAINFDKLDLKNPSSGNPTSSFK